VRVTPDDRPADSPSGQAGGRHAAPGVRPGWPSARSASRATCVSSLRP
jgi:hypothetical protein